ncbi:carcinoembryonic antigen-related cell adhesion molecule 21-like isoform X2 [Pleurodeles waltl]|uniref:carcinoembryonic antigen-related cell adhesion molecule 21-like isoform X2 n=1 Tax=Pleurodeles waltl TaxID=8319 RepID=UPI0037098247
MGKRSPQHIARGTRTPWSQNYKSYLPLHSCSSTTNSDIGAEHTASLCVWPQRTATQGPGAGVVTAAVGQTVTLTAPVTAGILAFAWHRGTVVTNRQLILSYLLLDPTLTTGPEFTGRENLSSDGTLDIRDLRTSDSGIYTVSMTSNTAAIRTGNQQLRVYEPVTKPTVKYVSPQLVENRCPVEITCDTPSMPVTILWSFNGSPTLPGNIILSADNRTLTISNVPRDDSGIYQCVALNPVSISTSDPQTLTVICSACPIPGSCWQTTLGVACGVLLGAAIIVAGVAVHYERRLKQKGTSKDENLYQNASVIKNPDTQVENMRKGRNGQSADLKHADLSIYEPIRRP